MPRIRTTKQPWRVIEVSARELADLKAQRLLLRIEPDVVPELEADKTPTQETTPKKRSRRTTNPQKVEDSQ